MVKEYGYEYDAALDEKLWAETKGKVTDQKIFGAYCLRSGRDTLKAIAREFEPCVALLPALSCDSMVFPFELYGHEIKYYSLNEDYSISIDSLKQSLGKEKALFLYMDYFGKKAIRDETLLSLRKSYDLIFIEDRTHNLLWERNSSFQPDYIMASLRKWLPVPDGGLLWGDISKPFGNDTSFSSTRLKAQNMRHEYLKCGDEVIKAKFRKIFSTVSDIMDKDEPSAMSAYSFELAKSTDFEQIKSVRKDNAEVLSSILSSSKHISFIQNTPGISDLYVAFTVSTRDEVQRRLSSIGIFNTIIWPLTDEQKDACNVAKLTEENMLAAPCDQRYGIKDMEYIGKEIVRIVEDVNR